MKVLACSIGMAAAAVLTPRCPERSGEPFFDAVRQGDTRVVAARECGSADAFEG
jgi:hypothetical protein